MARAGKYYRPPFKGYRRVTQVHPLPPTLFNVVVDAIIRHWVTVVAATEADTEGIGLSIQDLAVYFYANDGIVASIQHDKLQLEFDVLTGLFKRVGLRTNTRKTV